MKHLKHGNLFIVIVSTKLYDSCITSTCDDLHNFGQTKWPDHNGHHLYIPTLFLISKLALFVSAPCRSKGLK